MKPRPVQIVLSFMLRLTRAESFWNHSVGLRQLSKNHTENGAIDHLISEKKEAPLNMYSLIGKRARTCVKTSSWSLTTAAVAIATVFVIFLCSLRHWSRSSSEGLHIRRLAIGGYQSFCEELGSTSDEEEGKGISSATHQLYSRIQHTVTQASSLVIATTHFSQGHAATLTHIRRSLVKVFSALRFSLATNVLKGLPVERLLIASERLVENTRIAEIVFSAQMLESGNEPGGVELSDIRWLSSLAGQVSLLCSQLKAGPAGTFITLKGDSVAKYVRELRNLNSYFRSKVIESLRTSRNLLFNTLWPVLNAEGLPLLRSEVYSITFEDRKKEMAPMMLHLLSLSLAFASSNFSPEVRHQVVAEAFEHAALQVLVLKWKARCVLTKGFLQALSQLGRLASLKLQELRYELTQTSASCPQNVDRGFEAAESMSAAQSPTEAGAATGEADSGRRSTLAALDIQNSKVQFFVLAVETTILRLRSQVAEASPEGSMGTTPSLDQCWAITGALYSSYLGAALLQRTVPEFMVVEKGLRRRAISRFLELMVYWRRTPLRSRANLYTEQAYRTNMRLYDHGEGGGSPFTTVNKQVKLRPSTEPLRDNFLHLADYVLRMGGSGEGTALRKPTRQSTRGSDVLLHVWETRVFDASGFDTISNPSSYWPPGHAESLAGGSLPDPSDVHSSPLVLFGTTVPSFSSTGDSSGNTDQKGSDGASGGPTGRSEPGNIGATEMQHIVDMLNVLLEEEEE